MLWHTNYTDICYGYRAIRKNCLKQLNLKSNGFEIETELAIKVAKHKLRVIEIPSFERLRKGGKGKLNLIKDGFRICNRILLEIFTA